MQIHELNDFGGNLGINSFVAVDDGADTGKLSTHKLLESTNQEIANAVANLNGRIDNIIAGGDAPSAAEVVDARHGAEDLGGNDYASLGTAIRSQITDVKGSSIESGTKASKFTTIWSNSGANVVPGYLKSDGTIGSANDAYVSNYFHVIAGEALLLRMEEGYSGSSIHVCFYDSDKSLVEYSSHFMDSRRCAGKVVPATAVYCRFDFLKTFPNPTAEQNSLCNILPNEKNSPRTVQGELKDVPVLVGSLSLVPFSTGWLNPQGNVTGNVAKTAKYIPLTSNNPLIKNGRYAINTTITVCFYDGNLSLVQIEQNRNKQVEVPAGALYFSYSIDDAWTTDEDFCIYQIQRASVPTKSQIEAQLGLPLNIRYRGLLAGFGNSEISLRVFGTNNFQYFEEIGEAFKPLKGNAACRDPFIMVYGDYFYIFYTDTPNFTTDNNDIGVCRTKDFFTYEELDPIVCNANFKVCWAPSVFFENGSYYLTVTGSTLDYSETYTYLYDLDMETLAISNERIVSVGSSTRQLDFHFEKWNGVYYAIGKYDNSATTVIGTASSLNGPYTVIANQRYSNKPEEGQQIIRMDDGGYRLYINDYSQDQLIHYVDIPDITHPTDNVGALKTIASDSPVALFHVYIKDFNKPYAFQNC